MGIGPRLMNLSWLVMSMELYVNGRNLKWELKSIKNLIFLESEKITEHLGSELLVEARFKGFSCTLNIPSSISEISDPSSSCLLTISTLQKNNPSIWITDWLKWHHRMHGVQRLVLYDNGSNNSDDLIQSLLGLNLDINIVFVHWNFPHGHGSSIRLTCQKGSLNHCRLRFSIHGGYCINNDIDEYVVCLNGKLIDYVQNKLRYPRPGALLYKGISVPNIKCSETKLARVTTFKYIKNESSKRELKFLRRHVHRPKYIYSFDDIGYNGVHATDSMKNFSFAKTLFYCNNFGLFRKKSNERNLQADREKDRVQIHSCEN